MSPHQQRHHQVPVYAAWRSRALLAQRAVLKPAVSSGVHIEERLISLSRGVELNVLVARFVGSTSESDCSSSSTSDTLSNSASSPACRSVGVLLHGWGAGLCVYTRVLPILVRQFQVVYLVDLPGMGLSSRNAFPRIADGVDKSLSFFLEPLDELIRNLSRTDVDFASSPHRVLIAHSLGAYIATEWMIRLGEEYSQTLFQKLVLVSPVGVPSRPDNKKLCSVKHMPHQRKGLSRVLDVCWRTGITPQCVLRSLPAFLGRKMSDKFVEDRYSRNMPREEFEAVTEYVYCLSKAPPSSELAMSTLLLPGAWPKRALRHRLHLVHVPTAFIYGDKDWMDWRHAEHARRNMKVRNALAVVQNASHNVFIDNPRAFARALDLVCFEKQAVS